LDSENVMGMDFPISREEQAIRYGAEWLRIEWMLARGEKIPQEQ
jgi:hypothetical protein